MTAAELVCKLSECGFRFTLVGGNVMLKHTGRDDPKADEVLPLVAELKQNKAAVIQYLKDKHLANSTKVLIEDIEKLKIECVVAQEMLVNADKEYRRTLAVCKQAFDRVVCARRNFDDARNRLLSEITCEEIQRYYQGLDGDGL